MQQAKLVVLSAVIALLVWLVADHSLTDTATLRARVKLVSAGGSDMRVTALSPQTDPFEIQVSGRKAIVARLKAREPLTIRVPVSSRESGRYKLRLLDEIRGTEGELSEVLIRSISPPEVDILVDRKITVTMPVVVLSGSLNYERQPVIEPSEVKVTISELEYNALDESARCVLVDPDEYLRTAPRGRLLSEPVPLHPVVGGVSVELDPDFGTLRAMLKEELQEATISAVPVRFEASLDIFNDYNVEVKDAAATLTRPVTIKGPAEVIERIQAGEIKLRGIVTLKAADKAEAGQFRYQTPAFNLPEEVAIIGEVDPVEYRLVEKAGTSPPKP